VSGVGWGGRAGGGGPVFSEEERGTGVEKEVLDHWEKKQGFGGGGGGEVSSRGKLGRREGEVGVGERPWGKALVYQADKNEGE